MVILQWLTKQFVFFKKKVMENIFILKIENKKEQVFKNEDLAQIVGIKSGKNFTVEPASYNDSDVYVEIEGKELYLLDEYSFKEELTVETYVDSGETETDFISFSEEIVYTPYQKNEIDKVSFEGKLFSEIKISVELRLEIDQACSKLLEKLDEELEN